MMDTDICLFSIRLCKLILDFLLQNFFDLCDGVELKWETESIICALLS